MIKIDKTDGLYKYLAGLNVKNVDDLYIELAKNGRYKKVDVQQYFQEIFRPSSTEDVADEDLEKVLDYFVDLKKLKNVNKKSLNEMLKKYSTSHDKDLKNLIVNAKLKDVLYLCLNYKTLHKDMDIQDLVQIASLGLMDAVENYIDTAKIDFNDYVVYYVRERILKEYEEKK